MSYANSLRGPARSVLRSSRNQRVSHIRFQSSNASQTASTGSSHVMTGVASGTAVALISYGLYTLTPAGRVNSRINSAAYEADKTYKEAMSKLQQSTPDTNQAIEYLKQQAYSYAAFVPGGRAYVDTAFKDLDTIRQGHGEEVDKIVSETYRELQEISKGGLSTSTVTKLLDALRKFSTKIGGVAADGMSDLIDNHPQLKEKLGPGMDQLKQMGDTMGPEVKKEVSQTWDKAQEILKGGFSVASVNKIRELIQEKVESVKKLGDKAWEEGMEKAKPYLEKNPAVKKLVEENADALKQGNAMELFAKVKDSVQSGNVDDLKKYISGAADKFQKNSGEGFGGLEQYVKMIPGSSEILPKLKSLQSLAKVETEEAETLFKETIEKLNKVVKEQSGKAEELVKKSQK